MNSFELIKKNIIVDPSKITALGIGDILNSLVLLKNNIIQPPIYINLFFFKDNTWYSNPQNFLDFRLKLIEYMCINNNIDLNNIKLLDFDNANSNNYVNQHLQEIPKINNWNLKIILNTPNNNINSFLNNEYIIFHTKCRFIQSFDYETFKSNISAFYNTYKTKYTIVLLGEKEIQCSECEKIHGITTIYNELTNLKKNNTVIDLTIDNIYKELNFDNYLNDMVIINKAKYNILVGIGGPFVNSLVFGKNTITYLTQNILNDYVVTQNENIITEIDYNLFIKL
jgi:hypothetical protein